MDLLSRTDLEELGARHESGTHVSLFAPTHRYGRDVNSDPISWKNLLSETESALVDEGLDRSTVTQLLKPAWDLHGDTMAWQNMSDGLAFFLRPGWNASYRLPVQLPHIAMIGDRFVTSPLLPALANDAQFLVLAVSQRKVRLLRGTHGALKEIELHDVPTSLREIMEPHQPRSNTITRPVSRASQRAVFFGHGAGDDHMKKDEVQRFLRKVATGIQGYLGEQQAPMVLVGLEEMVATYREVNQYPHLVAEDVRTNPDELSIDQLQDAAWPIIEQQLRRKRNDDGARFGQLNGTGRASGSLSEIESAASEGRVETLFATTEQWVAAKTGPRPPVVSLGRDEQFRRLETMDRVMTDVLSQSGRMYAVPAPEVPGGGEMAAIFRY